MMTTGMSDKSSPRGSAAAPSILIVGPVQPRRVSTTLSDRERKSVAIRQERKSFARRLSNKSARSSVSASPFVSNSSSLSGADILAEEEAFPSQVAYGLCFHEFTDCLVACALYWDPSPFATCKDRVEKFLTIIFKGIRAHWEVRFVVDDPAAAMKCQALKTAVRDDSELAEGKDGNGLGDEALRESKLRAAASRRRVHGRAPLEKDEFDDLQSALIREKGDSTAPVPAQETVTPTQSRGSLAVPRMPRKDKDTKERKSSSNYVSTQP